MIVLDFSFYESFTTPTLDCDRRPNNTVDSVGLGGLSDLRFQATLGRSWGSLMLEPFEPGGYVHKSIGVFVLIALGLAMVGCGSNGSNSTNINGNWSASMTSSPSGPTIYAFTTTFTEASGGGLTITN